MIAIASLQSRIVPGLSSLARSHKSNLLPCYLHSKSSLFTSEPEFNLMRILPGLKMCSKLVILSVLWLSTSSSANRGPDSLGACDYKELRPSPEGCIYFLQCANGEEFNMPCQGPNSIGRFSKYLFCKKGTS